jgi:peptide/nickel transport system permease protein
MSASFGLAMDRKPPVGETAIEWHVSIPLRVLRQLVRQPATLIALIYLFGLFALAVTDWTLHPLNPNAQDLAHRLQGPTGAHPFGTDNLGRDIMARIVSAAGVAVLALLEGVGIAAVLGIVPGLLAGFAGGLWNTVFTRIADVLIVFPGLVLALAIVGTLGPSLTNAMIAVGIINAPRLFRIVRSAALDVRDSAYVDAARTMGARSGRIIWAHIAPNVTGVMAVQVALVAAQVLLAEAGLSYLGLGVQQPQASWGSMIKDAQPYITTNPWSMVVPGIVIMLTVTAFNFTADGISRALRASIGVDTSR